MKNSPETITRAAEWMTCDDTGISSETIWAVMMGVPAHKIDADIPHDAGDFGRCVALIDFIPEWKDRLCEVAAAFPEWKEVVRNWDTLHKRLLDLRAAQASMDVRAANEAYKRFDQEFDRCTGGR